MSARILIIEDNQANIELVSYLLEAYGFAVASARSGAEGLVRASRDPPDVILCDVQMPGMDGLEVVERLKRDNRLRGIPVIAMTSYAMSGDHERLLAAGFDGHISKPIRHETFIAQLQGWTARSSAAAAAGTTRTAEANAPARGPVLVVDDSAADAQWVDTALRKRGYRIGTARSCTEGVRIALEQRPRLILSDVHVGGESGFEFLSRIRAHRELEAIPFVFLSSTDCDDYRRGRESGARDFIQRPIGSGEFRSRIKACLRGNERARANPHTQSDC